MLTAPKKQVKGLMLRNVSPAAMCRASEQVKYASDAARDTAPKTLDMALYLRSKQNTSCFTDRHFRAGTDVDLRENLSLYVVVVPVFWTLCYGPNWQSMLTSYRSPRIVGAHSTLLRENARMAGIINDVGSCFFSDFVCLLRNAKCTVTDPQDQLTLYS
jgi:hypothetical protein